MDLSYPFNSVNSAIEFIEFSLFSKDMILKAM